VLAMKEAVGAAAWDVLLRATEAWPHAGPHADALLEAVAAAHESPRDMVLAASAALSAAAPGTPAWARLVRVGGAMAARVPAARRAGPLWSLRDAVAGPLRRLPDDDGERRSGGGGGGGAGEGDDGQQRLALAGAAVRAVADAVRLASADVSPATEGDKVRAALRGLALAVLESPVLAIFEDEALDIAVRHTSGVALMCGAGATLDPASPELLVASEPFLCLAYAALVDQMSGAESALVAPPAVLLEHWFPLLTFGLHFSRGPASAKRTLAVAQALLARIPAGTLPTELFLRIAPPRCKRKGTKRRSPLPFSLSFCRSFVCAPPANFWRGSLVPRMIASSRCS
jgi:hypothetical protein